MMIHDRMRDIKMKNVENRCKAQIQEYEAKIKQFASRLEIEQHRNKDLEARMKMETSHKTVRRSLRDKIWA